jgi:hypothetical protein
MCHWNTKSRSSLLHHLTGQLKVVVQAMGGAISTDWHLVSVNTIQHCTHCWSERTSPNSLQLVWHITEQCTTAHTDPTAVIYTENTINSRCLSPIWAPIIFKQKTFFPCPFQWLGKARRHAIKYFVSDNDDLWNTKFMTHSITKIHDMNRNKALWSASFISESAERNSMQFSTVLKNLRSEFIFFYITRRSRQIVNFQVLHETNCTWDKHISNYSLQFTWTIMFLLCF